VAETYAVVLLVEENLTSDDATRIHSLHEGIEDPVAYHVLMPLDDGRARVQAALGASGGLGVDMVPGRPIPLPDIDPQEIVDEARERTERELANAVQVLQATGATATGELVHGDPVDALAAKVKEVNGREAIVLTEEHFVAELLRLDWTSKARRHLDVPVLHLMEQENFDEQAGGGEGASLI
jgi:hypothetical protein